MTTKKVFVSHSHSDKPIAERVARELLNQGIDAWLDKWEIQPGDSLIQKVFEEGLKQCSAFLVLLSQQSVSSNWVKHELDVAMVRRLEGAARVIPVMVEQCEIPTALRPLLWVDITKEFETGIRRIADVILGRTDKPPIQEEPSRLRVSVPGLTGNAARLALFLSESMESPAGRAPNFDGRSLATKLGLSPEQVSDAAEELESKGLVTLHRYLGTAPFTFGAIEATYALALQLRGTGAIAYDPEEDILMVASAIAAMRAAHAASLQATTKLSPSRLNNAVKYLDDYGIAQVLRALGTAPFDFMEIRATSNTRRFTAEHSR